MRARDYNKIIYIYEYTSIPDGFGGNTVSKVQLGASWCKLINKATTVSQRTTALGLSELQEPLIFKVRYRNDMQYQGRTLSLSYNGSDYAINAIADVDMMHRELEIVCTKIPDQVDTSNPNKAFEYILPLRFIS